MSLTYNSHPQAIFSKVPYNDTTQVAPARNLGEVLNFVPPHDYLYLTSQLPESIEYIP